MSLVSLDDHIFELGVFNQAISKVCRRTRTSEVKGEQQIPLSVSNTFQIFSKYLLHISSPSLSFQTLTVVIHHPSNPPSCPQTSTVKLPYFCPSSSEPPFLFLSVTDPVLLDHPRSPRSRKPPPRFKRFGTITDPIVLEGYASRNIGHILMCGLHVGRIFMPCSRLRWPNSGTRHALIVFFRQFWAVRESNNCLTSTN